MFPFGAHEGLGLNPALHPALAVLYCFPRFVLLFSILKHPFSVSAYLLYSFTSLFLSDIIRLSHKVILFKSSFWLFHPLVHLCIFISCLKVKLFS